MTDTTSSSTTGKTAVPAGAISDFGIDTTAQSTKEAVFDYLARLRGGELGSLPALLGLAVLVIIFARGSASFLTLDNMANLLAQGAGQMIIAMGLVFVLLLGEIDLSAGTASGVCASVMALHFVEKGNLLGGMHGSVFNVYIGGLVVAAALALIMRLWPGAVMAAIALGLSLSGIGANPWVEMLLALCVGTS